MTRRLPDKVIEVIIKALENGDLIQKQARLCDLAALDAIPSEILPHLKLHHQKAIALSPVTSERILLNLARSQYEKVRLAVPKNYNHKFIAPDYYDSPEYLRKLANSHDLRELNKVASHRNTPLDVLKKLAKDWIANVGFSLAKNPNSTEEIILKVLFYKRKSKNLTNRHTIAYIQLPVSIKVEGKEYFIQAPLIDGCDYKILVAAASHPKLSLDIVEQLIEKLPQTIKWGAYGNEILAGLVSNPNIPISILEWLASDDFFSIYNDAIYKQIIHYCSCESIYLNDPKAEEKYQINQDILLKKSHLRDSCNKTTTRSIGKVYWGIVQNIATSSELKLALLEKLTSNKIIVQDVYYHIARSPDTSPKILARLAKVGYHWALVQNVNTPHHVLAEFAHSRHIDVREYVAKNPSTPLEALAKLAKDKSKNIQVAVASNPNTPINALEELEQTMEHSILVGLAKNPKLPINLLQRIADNHLDIYSIPVLLAQNPNTPLSLLERLAEHRDSLARWSVAEKINNPLPLLEKLSRLKSGCVKEKAINRLRSIYKEKAANPETSIEELQKMLKHQDIEVRQAVKLHPQGLNLLLDRCLKPERHFAYQNSLHRVLTGMYPKISTEQIDNLFYSENWLDRLAVACNPKIPREYLTQLTEDKNIVIKEIAEEFLLERDC